MFTPISGMHRVFGATREGCYKLRVRSLTWRVAKLQEHDSILLSVTTSKLFVTVCKGGEDVPQLGMNAPRLTQLDKDGPPG